MSQQNQKSIKEMTKQELEAIELKMWRQRESLTNQLNETINNIHIISAELVERHEPTDNG